MLRLLALLLLWTDCPLPDALDHLAGVPGFQEELRAIAVEEQWVGPREHIGWNGGDEDGAGLLNITLQVAWLRVVRDDLAGVPRLEATALLPPASFAEGQKCFADAHIRYLEARREVCTADVRWYYDEWITEAKRHRAVWAAVEESRREYCGWKLSWRRQALQTVVDLIGPDALAAGDLPPAVPLGRFRRVGE